jgi:hypothetical protein
MGEFTIPPHVSPLCSHLASLQEFFIVRLYRASYPKHVHTVPYFCSTQHSEIVQPRGLHAFKYPY